jgi:hemerythrin-like metal-binding protein
VAFFAWNSQLETGIKSIDDQHKILFDFISRLHEAMKKGQGNTVIGPILNDLASYTRTHFENEEKLFKAHKYPQEAGHKKIHDDLRAQVEDLRKKVETQKSTISVEVMTFLRDWLQEHILGHDMRYAPFLKQKGVA